MCSSDLVAVRRVQQRRQFGRVEGIGHAVTLGRDGERDARGAVDNTLAAIGIHDPKLRKRAVAIGEKIGLYRDWPVSKGCTPPYVPVWVEAMVKRKG